MANIIIITGNLGDDVEKINTSNGGSFYRFSVATSENWKDKDGNKQSKTTWHKCMLNGNYDALAQYLVKGQTVSVQGVQRNDIIDYKVDNQVVQFNGNPIKTTYSFIKVDRIELIGSKQKSDEQQPAAQTSTATATATASATKTANAQPQGYPEPDDDLPF